jgi:hypothetical protein
MLQRSQLWQNVVGPQNHKCVWNTTKVCTFIEVSVQTGVCFVAHTCEYSTVRYRAVSLMWWLHMWHECFMASYCKPWISNDPTWKNPMLWSLGKAAPPFHWSRWTNPPSRQKWSNHWHRMYKPLWCSIRMCGFVDLQHFAIIIHTITSFLHENIKTQWFSSIFLFHVVSVFPSLSHPTTLVTSPPPHHLGNITVTSYYWHIKTVVL